jgi:hypothetical protein
MGPLLYTTGHGQGVRVVGVKRVVWFETIGHQESS